MKKIIFVSLFMLLLASQASAGVVPCGLSQDDLDQPGNQTVRCTLCHFLVMGKNIIDLVLLKIIPPLAILFVIIGGTYFILGAGYDPALISKAKSLFWAVAMGLLITYGAWLAINLFFTVIGVANWTGLSSGWWQINCPI